MPSGDVTPGKTNGHTFEPGQKVKQVKDEAGHPKMFGIGEVIETRAGLIKVKDPAGWFHKISPECLAPV